MLHRAGRVYSYWKRMNEREQIVEVIDFTGRRVTGRKGSCQDPRNETNNVGIEDQDTRYQGELILSPEMM